MRLSSHLLPASGSLYVKLLGQVKYSTELHYILPNVLLAMQDNTE